MAHLHPDQHIAPPDPPLHGLAHQCLVARTSIVRSLSVRVRIGQCVAATSTSLRTRFTQDLHQHQPRKSAPAPPPADHRCPERNSPHLASPPARFDAASTSPNRPSVRRPNQQIATLPPDQQCARLPPDQPIGICWRINALHRRVGPSNFAMFLFFAPRPPITATHHHCCVVAP